MKREEIYRTLTEVFRDVFDDESLTIQDETTAEDIEDWDSLEHITLIAAIEDAFDIKFRMNEVSTMKDVGEMVDIILERA